MTSKANENVIDKIAKTLEKSVQDCGSYELYSMAEAIVDKFYIIPRTDSIDEYVEIDLSEHECIECRASGIEGIKLKWKEDK